MRLIGQNKALWSLFGTVINSIQPLEDTDTNQKEITIEVLCNSNVQMRPNADGTKTEKSSRFE